MSHYTYRSPAQVNATAAAMRCAKLTTGSRCKSNSTAQAIEQRQSYDSRLDSDGADWRYLREHGWRQWGRGNWEKRQYFTWWSKDGHCFPQHVALWLERKGVNRVWWGL